MPKMTEETPIGSQVGNWTVLAHIKQKSMSYLCRCKCGKEKLVSKSNLQLGKSTSCGKGVCKIPATITHGLSDHPLFSVWSGIKNRLANPTGKNSCYAGISLDDSWKEFKTFYTWAIANGYEKGLTIDRRERDGNYTPDNCRWVSAIVQSQNRSKRGTKLIPYKGVYESKPRAGKKIYQGTGNNPYYWIVIYNGKRNQKWGFPTPEDAYKDRLDFIEKNYKGLVYPD